MNIKQKSLNVCLIGFKIKEYLSVRAKSALDNKELKKEKIKAKDVETKYQELYLKLKKWRYDEAQLHDVKLFQIAANKTLQEIANNIPTTAKQLKAISGIGKKKFDTYGKDLINIVLSYIDNNNIEPNEEIVEPIKETKKKTIEISYELYKEGKTLNEIAEIRELKSQTIENHLGYYVASGELKIEEFVDAKTVELIKEYFGKNPESTLSEAKTSLSDEITWGQLKLVQNYMAFLKL